MNLPAWSQYDEPEWRKEDDPVLSHPRIATTACTCHVAPEQHEGTLVDGRAFYFRLRFSRVTLGVGATLSDAVEDGWDRRAVAYEPPPRIQPTPVLEGILARIPRGDGGRRIGLTGSFDTDEDRQRIFAELLEDIA